MARRGDAVKTERSLEFARFVVAAGFSGGAIGVAEGVRLLLVDGGATSPYTAVCHIALALGLTVPAALMLGVVLAPIVGVLALHFGRWLAVGAAVIAGAGVAAAFLLPEETRLPWGHLSLSVVGAGTMVAAYAWPWQRGARVFIASAIGVTVAALTLGASSDEARDRVEDRGLFAGGLLTVARGVGGVFAAHASVPVNDPTRQSVSARNQEPPPPRPASQGQPPALVAAGSQRPRARAVVLITIDSLRADHVGAYGYQRATTPAIDRLAKRGLRFERAYAQAPHTWRSIPSLVTGLYPSEVAMTRDRPPTLFTSNPFLGESLAGMGVAAEAILTHWMFDAVYGYARGFSHWNTDIATRDRHKTATQATAERAVSLAIDRFARWEAQGAGQLFLWVHAYDPHAHWISHDGVVRFGDEPIDRYDHEIAYSDKHVGRLLARIEASRYASEIGVIVTSDHGEALGDHGIWYHGQGLFDHQIRVPLIVAGPGIVAGVERRTAALLDVPPTVVSWLGGEPDARWRGVDLIDGRRRLDGRIVYSELLTGPYSEPMQAAIDGRWKLIRWSKGARIRLFDLDADPAEWRNRARRNADVLARLSSALAELNASGVHY